MSGYRCFMKSVRLNFLLIFFLIFGLSYQGYADCPPLVESNTTLDAGGKKALEGFLAIFTFGTKGSFKVDEKLYQYITVRQVKDQGIDGYFNPKIQVCDYEGKDNCYILPSGTSCRQIYGTQDTGGGVSAAVFIDWEGDKTSANAKIADSLEWEWADNVTDEEKTKFAKSPKICACSQKGACMSGGSAWFSRVVQGENIFRPGDMENVCDTCSSWSKGKQKIKCAPVPLAPSPPPFCEQLAMSPPQVKIVPIANKDNDYFDPKVKVIAGGLIIEEDGKIGKGLDFPEEYRKGKPKKHSIVDGYDTTHYFTTYREKGKLCAEYHGTQGIDEKNPQFVRCFPAPPAPEPKVVKIADENTLEVEMKMSESTCTYKAHGTYSSGFCTFHVDRNRPTNIGPMSLTVVKPAIVAKTTDSGDSKSNIYDIIEGILESNPQQFKILKNFGYVPDIETKCEEFQGNECKLDNLGRPKIEVKYKDNSNSKMLCLSGWQPEPEEFVFKIEGKITPLKLVGTSYDKYNSVYSKESNQFYYSQSDKIVDLLKRPQNELDRMIFNRQGYVFFPDENKQKKGKCSYCVKRNDEIDKAFTSNKGLKAVYKLIDGKHEGPCEQGQDGCICSGETCRRSTQYLNKNEDDRPFYLSYKEVDCRDKDGKILTNEKGEAQKCTQLKDQPIKANRTEVFYADKLCKLNWEGIKEKVKKTIKKRLQDKPDPRKGNGQPHDFGGGNHDVDGSQIPSSHVEIEVWGPGEAGHIKNTPAYCTLHVHDKKNACSTETRIGMPGDYIKAELEIDPDYPIIGIKVSEGGGNQESRYTDKDGGPIFIRKCKPGKQECKDLIIMGGGGIYKMYPHGGIYYDYKKTIIDDSVKLKKQTIVTKQSTGYNEIEHEDNKIAYIENGEIKYEAVECRKGFRSSKPGAGGCIDKSKGIYGKGSAGYMKITPIIKGFDEEMINNAIENTIGDQYELGDVRDFLTDDIDTSTVKAIEEELKKELLRVQ